LKPSQIPIKPPTALKTIDEKEKKPAPQRLGIKLPIVEPTTMPIYIVDFLLIISLYQKGS
jgi:hypothetical protein